MRVEIPVLSLITMPYFNIQRAEFDMGINIISRVGKIDTTGETEPASSAKTESLVAMLGSQSNQNLQRVDSSGTVVENYQAYDTNMRAKLEVVSSDLPAGIMQLINLSQEGIQGEQNYDYEITSDNESLIFTPDNLEQTLDFHIKPLRSKEPAASYQQAKITVTSNTDEDLNQQFSEPIQIIKGNPIGTPTKALALLMTNENGRGSVTFNAAQSGIGNNGFVQISTDVTKNINIYYRIKS